MFRDAFIALSSLMDDFNEEDCKRWAQKLWTQAMAFDFGVEDMDIDEKLACLGLAIHVGPNEYAYLGSRAYELYRNGLVDIAARAAHEANRAYCESIGDDSQKAWDDAPDWQKESAVDGVKHAFDGSTPEQAHERWMDLKKEDGWVYGPEKNPDWKTHPCLVPYDKLPEYQRRKDDLFVAIARAVTEAFK